MTFKIDLVEPTNTTPYGEILEETFGGDVVTTLERKTERSARKVAIRKSKREEWYEAVLCIYDGNALVRKEFYKNGEMVYSHGE